MDNARNSVIVFGHQPGEMVDRPHFLNAAQTLGIGIA